MRYNDIITERELNEGPLDFIKQKAGQAADWAADKLGYQPKQAPATKVNKAAAQDFDFDKDVVKNPVTKSFDIGGDAVDKAIASRGYATAADIDALPAKPQKTSGGGFQGSRSVKIGGKEVTGKTADLAVSAIKKAQQLRRDQMAAGSTDPADIRAYKQKMAKTKGRGVAGGTDYNTF